MRARASVLVGSNGPHVLYTEEARFVSVENSGHSALCMEEARYVNVGNKGPHALSMGRFTMTPLYGAEQVRSE